MKDVCIIGAGVIGASIARELSKYQLKVAVLEAKSDVATGSSGANSAIVHAGYDCIPGTKMAYLNVKGNKLYDRIKEELEVPFERRGSLVIAFDKEDKKELEKLMEQGIKNGVPNLQILSADETLEMEPNLNTDIVGALWAPTAGITCPYELTVAMMENAVENGVEVHLDCPVLSIEKRPDGLFDLKSLKGSFKSRFIINCAGVYSDDISRMVGAESFEIRPRKGEYCLYDRQYGDTVQKVIFQPPGKMSKGILVTPTVDGNLLIGPNAVDVDQKDDTSTSQQGLDFVYQKAKQSVPGLSHAGVITTFSGLRAISSTGDFIIEKSQRVDGFIQVAGICSPGLSAAPAIAEEVVDLVSTLTGTLEKNPSFNPYRMAIPHFRKMSWEDRERMIQSDPHYGRIICRCESVTEGEILEALRRKLPVTTLDAVKRRTRAGMGRCQGGFCAPRVMEIMERELGIPLTEITKRGGMSRMVIGKIKELNGEGVEI